VVEPPTRWSVLRLGAADDTRELVRLRQVWAGFSVRKMLVTGDEPPLLESFPNGDKVEWKIYILKDNFSGQIIATSHDLGPQIVVE